MDSQGWRLLAARPLGSYSRTVRGVQAAPCLLRASSWTDSSLHTPVFPSSACDREGICGWVLSLQNAGWHHKAAGRKQAQFSELHKVPGKFISVFFSAYKFYCSRNGRPSEWQNPVQRNGHSNTDISLPWSPSHLIQSLIRLGFIYHSQAPWMGEC